MKPRALILRAAGTNCDQETVWALELAGFAAEAVHVNRLLEDAGSLRAAQVLAIPGGFSYGDDVAAGRILASRLARHLGEAMRDFVAAGKPVIGICNGFQVLVKTDLLPGPLAGETGQTCTLTLNDCGRLVDRWVRVAPRSGRCIWTKGLEAIDLPVAHGEGKLVPLNEAVRKALWDEQRVALVYARAGSADAAGGAFPDNPNGSVDDIAGLCDATGLVFGLMPHPERFVSPLQHPAAWGNGPRDLDEETVNSGGAGMAIFRNAFGYVREAVGAGV